MLTAHYCLCPLMFFASKFLMSKILLQCCVPNAKSLREFVSRPPACSTRLHCTMIRHDDENNLSSGTCYTLYLEYLGGLVPLLKGKRTSKIRPEFVIFDPQTDGKRNTFLVSIFFILIFCICFRTGCVSSILGVSHNEKLFCFKSFDDQYKWTHRFVGQ